MYASISDKIQQEIIAKVVYFFIINQLIDVLYFKNSI